MTATDIVFVFETILIALGVACVYKLIGFILYVRKIKRAYKDVPGPKEKHWLFGTFPTLPEDDDERARYFIDTCNKYGRESGYVVMWGMFWQPFIVACSPRVMGTICKTTEPKPMGFLGVYKLIKSWLGDGLLVANGDKWARNRRLLTPAFHFEILKPYVNVYNDSANTLIKKLSAHADTGEHFEMFENISLCTLEVILRCAFSYDEAIQTVGESAYVQAVNSITDTFQYRIVRPYLQYDAIWNLTKCGKQFKKDCDYVHAVAENIIEKRRETLERTGNQEDRKYLDFLDILLTARDETGVGLTQLEIRNEVDTFLFEGHDTTASAISWLLYSLADNLKCQQKCQKEIDEILDGRDDGDIQWTDLCRLEYLTMCVKEGMRLHSPVPMVSRQTTKDFDVGGRVFPKGAIIQLNIWALNHMEHIWPDHMSFIPERFSLDNSANIEAFQYVPFSAGPRNCIGQHFAMNEEKVIIAKLLRSFTFTLDKTHGVKKKISAVMRTSDGMFFHVHKRQH